MESEENIIQSNLVFRSDYNDNRIDDNDNSDNNYNHMNFNINNNDNNGHLSYQT